MVFISSPLLSMKARQGEPDVFLEFVGTVDLCMWRGSASHYSELGVIKYLGLPPHGAVSLGV